MSNKPICVFQSPIYSRSGYGDWALTVAKSLLRYDKFDLYIAPTAWGACSKKNLESESKDPEGMALLNRILKGQLPRQPDVFIQMTIPNEFVPAGKYNIGMTAGIESTVPSPEWIEGLNRMNCNFVLSKFNKDVFESAKYNKKNPNGSAEDLSVKTPIEVASWAADTNIYKKTDEKNTNIEDALSQINETFGFLFVGQWTHGNIRADRKGTGYLIKTFLETFANVKNPPFLLLKTSGAQISTMDRYDCINKIHEVTNMVKSTLPLNATLPNVYLLHGELEDNEMNALFNHEKVKVHVSFTHGEGFGHPLLLSTLSGKPLIAPKWSGHLDFLNPKYANFFDGSLVQLPEEALNQWFVKDARWFDVDYKMAGEKMKHFFNYYSENMLSNSEKLRIDNIEKFSLSAMDKKFHALLDKHLPKFAIQEEIVLPKLKKLNLPSVTHNKVPVEINSPAPSTVKTTVDTTITKV